jgi:hypothetical protein
MRQHIQVVKAKLIPYLKEALANEMVSFVIEILGEAA